MRFSNVLLAFVLSAATPAAAAMGPLTISEAVDRALAQDSGLERLGALADARDERAVAESALPDPQVSIGYQNLPTRTFSTTDDMMTMLMVGVRQRIPDAGSRGLRRSIGGIEANALLAQREARALEVVAEVRRAWVNWRFAHRALEHSRAAEAEFAALVRLVEGRLATNRARQYDVLQARLESTALEERSINLESERAAALADLERWTGPIDGRTPEFNFAWPDPDPQVSLEDHPLLVSAQLVLEARTTGITLAERSTRPEWMVDLGYGIRNGTGRSDTLSGMISMSVPLFSRGRRDREIAASLREEDAARFAMIDQAKSLQAVVSRQWAIWQRMDRLVNLYRDRLIPDAEATSATALRAYQEGQVTFEELTRAQLAEMNIRIGALDAAMRRDQAHIQLLFLAGE